MKLTTRGRYALIALMELAEQGSTMPITLAAIADRQNLSVSYLEYLFRRLKLNHLVRSVRGPGGGYTLADSPSRISIARVVLAVDNSLLDIDINTDEHQESFTSFLDHRLWHGIHQKLYEYLDNITLYDLLKECNRTASVVHFNSLKLSPLMRCAV